MQKFAVARKLSDLRRKLWVPGHGDTELLHLGKTPGPLDDPRDPVGIGWDREIHRGLAAVTQETDVLDYASGGSDAVALSRDRLITGLALVADPWRHDVTTGTITPVQDAADKVISALSIAGGATYFNLSSTLLFLKGLSAMNKAVYGSSIPHEDLATGVGADNDSRQAWYLPFGAWNDKDKYDITAGIPAERETTLALTATFATNQLIAETAADGTIDAATDIYVVTFGVQGLSASYLANVPRPDYRHDHVQTPTSTTTIALQVGRFLKRTTIINLAVAANNNEARNDSNINVITIRFKKPTTTVLIERMRWRVAQSALSPFNHFPGVDRDGAAAIFTAPMAGVLVIDWRNFSKNTYGLNLYPFQSGDVELELELSVTTGSLHFFHEYYAFPDPSIAEAWNGSPYRPR